MTKTVIWGTIVLAVTIMTAGILAFMPLDEASSAGATRGNPTVRDTVTIDSITLVDGEAMVLVDNAGIGGTSDVEIVWRFANSNCEIRKLDSSGLSGPMSDDGAFVSVDPTLAHRDATNIDAIILFGITGGCEISADDSRFVTVSTVASSP